MRLEEVTGRIKGLDERAVEQAKARWASIAKPLHSLGKLEEHIVRIAGITEYADIDISKKVLLVFCADNGVVEEGVTQTGQEVTAVVAQNFLTCNTSAAIMCRKAQVDLFPVDVGMAADTKVLNYKIGYGTQNMAKGPAMTRKEALQGIRTGIRLVSEKKKEGYHILAVGEMGIGNTTTSSAVASILLGEPIEKMTGRGAGLDEEGLRRKIAVIKRAIELNRPDENDVLDILSKVGGYDLAALTGVYLGAAYYRLPVVMDGFISAASALAAVRLCPLVREYIIASHVSKEPGMRLILGELQMEAALTCDMCLGEGTGAVAYFPVLDMAAEVYQKMSTFEDNKIEAYKEYGEKS